MKHVGLARRAGIGNRAASAVNGLLLSLFAVLCLLPFLYVLAASFSQETELLKHTFIIFPVGFTLKNYIYVLTISPTIPRSLLVSIFVTVAGTALNLFVTALMAYPLAHTHMIGYKIIMPLVIFTLVFGGGMIPSYILVMKLGMLNTYWSIILPTCVTAYNLIIFISFFKAIPKELEEASKIDGCNDLRIWFQIILPVSKPLLATFALMFAVGYWNSWFNFVLYISDSTMWPIQVALKQIMATATGMQNDLADYVPPSDIISYCVIIISTVPILCVYPFLQKYFAKGIMIGSVKG